ncbi:MAG: hypothetical protein E6K70_21880, partial [Planctomycetota bacterium]
STGYFKSEEDKAIPALRPGFDRQPPAVNPIGGPVYLQGAAPGDTLVVSVEEIVVEDYSWIAIGPRRGPLGESTRWPELSAAYTTKIFRHTPGPSGSTRDGMLHFNQLISWPITPFVGTFGVAPEREVTTSVARCRAGQSHFVAGLSSRGALLPGRHPRQPGRYGVQRHRRGDQGHGPPEAGPDQGQTHAVATHRQAAVSNRRLCRPAARGGGGDRHVSSHGLAHWRVRLHAHGRLLPG